MAQAMGGELFVFYIDVGRDTRPEDQKSLAENIRFAENLGGKVIRTPGSSIADSLDATAAGAKKFIEERVRDSEAAMCAKIGEKFGELIGRLNAIDPAIGRGAAKADFKFASEKAADGDVVDLPSPLIRRTTLN